MATLAELKQMMPGQTEEWYQRITASYATCGAAAPVNAARINRMERSTAAPPPPPPKLSKQARKQAKAARSIPTQVSADQLQQAKQKQQQRAPQQLADNAIRRQLHNLLHSDREAADRIVAKVAASHPDKTHQWCYEKAVSDLLRDRH